MRVYDPISTVKHQFIHLCLHPKWIEKPMHIDVDNLLMVSVDVGNWHGGALYRYTDEEGGKWTLTFNYKGDVDRCKESTFTEVNHTNTYLGLNENPGYNALLIAKAIDR